MPVQQVTMKLRRLFVISAEKTETYTIRQEPPPFNTCVRSTAIAESMATVAGRAS